MGARKRDGNDGGKEVPLGRRVRLVRERMGLSREELAYRSGLSWSGLEQIESGRRRSPRPATLEALSRALGVSIDHLVHGGSVPVTLDHQLLIYEEDDDFVAAVGPFIRDGLERSESVMVSTTTHNIDVLRAYLDGDASGVMFMENEMWYRAPGTALGGFLGFVAERLAEGSPWIRIVGGPYWTGRSQDEMRATHQNESLINLVFGSMPATIVCGYKASLDPAILDTARRTHPRLNEGGQGRG